MSALDLLRMEHANIAKCDPDCPFCRIKELEAMCRDLAYAENEAQQAIERVKAIGHFVYIHEDADGEMHTHEAYPKELVDKALLTGGDDE